MNISWANDYYNLRPSHLYSFNMGNNSQNIGTRTVFSRYRSHIPKRSLFTESDQWRSVSNRHTMSPDIHSYIKILHPPFHASSPRLIERDNIIVWTYITIHDIRHDFPFPASFSQMTIPNTIITSSFNPPNKKDIAVLIRATYSNPTEKDPSFHLRHWL